MFRVFVLLLIGMSLSILGEEIEIFGTGKFSVEAVVIPDKSNSTVDFAARELAYHLKKATGKDLRIIREKSVNSEQKNIFLGDCRQSRETGLDAGKLKRNEAIIQINADNIFILGADDQSAWYADGSTGTLFGVYAFLEKYLSVRWLWPGELGEVIPPVVSLRIPAGRESIRPRLRSSRWRTMRNAWLWSDPENFKKYYDNQQLWLKRNRFSHIQYFGYGHAFGKYFEKYGKSHPEYFNLLPDNTRRPNPYDWSHGNPRFVSLCPTNEGLAKQVVDNWEKMPDRPWLINANENDTSGDCVCDNCLSADASPRSNKERRDEAAAAFRRKEKYWSNALGPVSGRYCKFLLNIQKEADKIDPTSSVMGLIYANYSEPPAKDVKLNERIILRFCPPVAYPFNQNKIADYKRIWAGWADTGAQLLFRPNFTLIQGFPIIYEDIFHDIFTFAYKHGMIASDMDSHTGHYGVQALPNYVIAALNHRPEVSLETLRNEFFSAFELAAPGIKKYFDHMRRVSMRPELTEIFSSEGNEGSNLFIEMFTVSSLIFPTKELIEGEQILNQTLTIPGLSAIAKRRVEFLIAGVRHARLLVEAQLAADQYKKTKNFNNFAAALRKLQKYRTKIEGLGAVDIGRSYHYEKRHWPWEMIPVYNTGAIQIKNWRVIIDTDGKGEWNRWFEQLPSQILPVMTDKALYEQSPFLNWAKQNAGKKFDSIWYFSKFNVPEKTPNRIYFMGLEGAATVYLNGKKIAFRDFPLYGNDRSWRDPFYVNIPSGLLKNDNTIAVKVTKSNQSMGIYRDVYLLNPENLK